jgi:hypothetical protein
MNIFILDKDPTLCAEYMIDKHVVKMPLEHAQMLSTACRLSGHDIGYKAAYQNHPCTKWARESVANFIYLRDLTLSIGEEYTRRYGKDHKSVELVKQLPVPDLPNLGITPFAQAMPDTYKCKGDAVKAYRAYYKGEKRGFASWKHGRIPEWFGAE